MIPIIVVLPLVLAAFAALFFQSSMKVRYLSLLASLVTLLLVVLLGTSAAATYVLPWFSLSGYHFALTFSTAPLNMLLLYLVAIVTPLVLAYSIGFMEVPSEQS